MVLEAATSGEYNLHTVSERQALTVSALLIMYSALNVRFVQ